MYRQSFPKCEIEGDMSPSSYDLFVFEGSIPSKCISCQHLFEASCTRDMELSDNYLRLDYPSCPINGETTPTPMKVSDEEPTFIPLKCKDCKYLNKDQLTCTFEKEIWGHFGRDLDWGDWQPDYPIVGFSRMEKQGNTTFYKGPAIITEQLVRLLQKQEIVQAVKLYRKLNKIELLKDAMVEVNEILARIQKRESK